MKSDKVLVHASQALFAAFVLGCLVAGCDKREEVALPEVYPAEGHAYMKDPAFKAQLQAQDKKRTAIMGQRERLIESLEALEKKSGTRAAAEKTPEWKDLMAQLQACSHAYESNRWETTALLRERMKRAQADSERIARGEAKSKVDFKSK